MFVENVKLMNFRNYEYGNVSFEKGANFIYGSNASGKTNLRGNEATGLVVDGNVRAENNTSFVYVLGTATEAISNKFITFVDKTPKRRQEDVKTDLYHYLNEQNTIEEEKFEDGWRIFNTEELDCIDNLPTETSLQRAFISYMKEEGSTFGSGCGMICVE